MNKQIKTIYFFPALLCFCLCFFGCGGEDDDNGPDPGGEKPAAALYDVTLTQTINGEKNYILNTLNEPLLFSSQLDFNEKTVNWSQPTLEQSFNGIFNLSEDRVSVTNAAGATVSSVTIYVIDNTVKVAFVKVNGSYSYLSSSTFKINIQTAIKSGLSQAEQDAFNLSGFDSQSLFYGEPAGQRKSSDAVSVNTVYKVTGDPKNDLYPYKLNVVYFVPTDVQENPGYKKRLSTILLKHQLFVCKWMKHWGYEEKSFGLPLNENGILDIVTVKGSGPLTNYPYEGGGAKIFEEVSAHYSKNQVKSQSDHFLIITAVNVNKDVNVPYYGSGRNCFAYDLPDLAYENMKIDPITNQPNPGGYITNNLVGGTLHELGHALNEPHVGSTYTQKNTNSSTFGMTLMGAGNQTYGKTPTFLHHASSATMNNCQVSSFTKKTFYGSVSASVNIDHVEINGGNCTVKGSFTASAPVTDVIIRFYNATEEFLGGSACYTSVAFVTKPTAENTFECIVPIAEMRVNSGYKDYRLGVTVLMDNGTATSMSQSYIYSLVNSGSAYTFQCKEIVNDGTWKVTTSHTLTDGTDAKNLVDGNLNTYIALVKPGKSYGGVTVPASDIVWTMVDFKEGKTFKSIVLTNRNSQAVLNPKTASFYGSNDETNFTLIKSGVSLPNAKTNEITLSAAVSYRYLKITFDSWDASSGNTIQVSELSLK